MRHLDSQRLMHVIGAVVLTAGLAWFQNSIQVDPPSYEPPRWWNFNGHPLFGVYAWSVLIAVQIARRSAVSRWTSSPGSRG